MNRIFLSVCLCLAAAAPLAAQEGRTRIDLNGTWEFAQTAEAFPPAKFSRKIPVPGLIFLAEPKIEQLEAYYKGDYQPRYNWYRRKFSVSAALAGREAVVTLLKSKYVTTVYLNGRKLGESMACYTPVEFPAGTALRPGAENEILVCVGDRKWLPSQAPGSTDKEKVTYWPGIWDDVFVTFSGNYRVDRALVLPELAAKKATLKLLLRDFYPAQIRYGDRMWDSCRVEAVVREKLSGARAAGPFVTTVALKRDNLTELALEMPFAAAHPWTPEDPFRYTVTVSLKDQSSKLSDRVEKTFGLRDFGRRGKHFTLNGQETILRGTNITLHRFFEDPECRALPWDREWTRRLMAEIPKKLDWNAMRVCVGICPDFWYDIADSCGLMLQNEWLYWQNHGWDEETRTEYRDWVWSDGSHPSIIIWDGINENWDDYIGNHLIPELKRLDPTRIWDAGYMTSEQMQQDEMDEPHPYRAVSHHDQFVQDIEKEPYDLGRLDRWPADFRDFLYSSSAQLVNEYGWIWLWRNGLPAKLTVNGYNYYTGPDATPEQRRELQAYWLQAETEWLRAERSFAGVLAFCYLTNDLGFTGDWFLNPIAKLEPSPTLKWFKHCFAPAAVFLNLTDQRWMKHVPPLEPGSELVVNLVGVNDLPADASGAVKVRLLDSTGREVLSQSLTMTIPRFYRENRATMLSLPAQPGGYLLLAEFTPAGRSEPVVSRRYIRVGKLEKYEFYDLTPSW
ncbi:glycoside hydrolase family 2 [bacterium]|nr:glycoside hydrolase family 2 [bacterium]